MAQSQIPNSIGSQFYIVQSTDARRFMSPEVQAIFESASENQDALIGEDEEGNNVYFRDIVPLDKIEAYTRYGGTPHLDLAFNQAGHTVFGQVIAGMDIVDAIGVVETDGDPPQGGNKPLTDVVIERVTVTTYELK